MVGARKPSGLQAGDVTDADPVDRPSFRHFLEVAAPWRRAQSPSFILIFGLGAAEAEGELGELLVDSLDEFGLGCLQ
jgi:hypothetical protein